MQKYKHIFFDLHQNKILKICALNRKQVDTKMAKEMGLTKMDIER